MSWEKLTERHNLDLPSQRNTDFNLFDKFIEANEIVDCRKSITYAEFEKFLQSGRDAGKIVKNECPPLGFHGHGYFYRSKTGDICYIYHPYTLEKILEPELKQWTKERDLKAVIYDKIYSWYNPNSTLLVVITLKNVNIKVFSR